MTRRNLTKDEQRYNEARQFLISSSDKAFIADAPMLFSSRVAVQNLISRYEIYKLIQGIPGDIIELGVYKGNSFSWMSHLSVILEPFSINRRLIGFDTFEGFASIDEKADPSDISSENFADTSYELINASLQMIDIVRPVNSINRFELVKGDILFTLPAYLRKHPWMTCALLILDTDLYKPTKLALETILPIMPRGAVVVFDEYNYQNFPGETQAIKDAIGINKLRVQRFAYESCLSYAVID